MINRKVSIMLLPQVFFYKKRKPLSSLIPQGLPPFHQHDLEHQIPQQEEGQKPQELTLRSQELLEQGPPPPLHLRLLEPIQEPEQEPLRCSPVTRAMKEAIIAARSEEKALIKIALVNAMAEFVQNETPLHHTTPVSQQEEGGEMSPLALS